MCRVILVVIRLDHQVVCAICEFLGIKWSEERDIQLTSSFDRIIYYILLLLLLECCFTCVIILPIIILLLLEDHGEYYIMMISLIMIRDDWGGHNTNGI